MASSPKEEKISQLVLELGNKIMERSGLTPDFDKVAKIPETEWISGQCMQAKKVIELRTAVETKDTKGVTTLRQFNPSFFLPKGSPISCRARGCPFKKPPKHSDDSKDTKQDLFLCADHRKQLMDRVLEHCEQENISISEVSNWQPDDFNGYTSLIGLLEKTYLHVKSCNLELAEVFLNVRNFLIITHALLNPEDDNVGIALPGIFAMLRRYLESRHWNRLVSMYYTSKNAQIVRG